MYQLSSKVITLDENQLEDIMCHSGYCHNVDLLVPQLANYLVFNEEHAIGELCT